MNPEQIANILNEDIDYNNGILLEYKMSAQVLPMRPPDVLEKLDELSYVKHEPHVNKLCTIDWYRCEGVKTSIHFVRISPSYGADELHRFDSHDDAGHFVLWIRKQLKANGFSLC